MAVVDVTFPQNKLFPDLITSPMWGVADIVIDIVRIAPRATLPCSPGQCLKLLRGETTEIPTPFAACKAIRSCGIPGYLSSVRAGAEGAVMLRRRPRSTVQEDDSMIEPLQFTPSGSEIAGGLPVSPTIVVTEGPIHVGKVRIVRADNGTGKGSLMVHKEGEEVFGEVAVVIKGAVRIEWKTVDGEVRKLDVPNGFEYGPFYNVHSCGSLKRFDNGHLDYTPHTWTFDDEKSPEGTVLALCHFEVPDASLEGPHRHCYT